MAKILFGIPTTTITALYMYIVGRWWIKSGREVNYGGRLPAQTYDGEISHALASDPGSGDRRAVAEIDRQAPIWPRTP
jgi:hypothetical protein